VTAVALTHRTARFRTARFRTVRALRLEIKHSAVVWVPPVLAALFYFNAYRTAAGYPPTWTVRASVITGPNLIFFSVIAAGIAAWVATREGRVITGIRINETNFSIQLNEENGRFHSLLKRDLEEVKDVFPQRSLRS